MSFCLHFRPSGGQHIIFFLCLVPVVDADEGMVVDSDIIAAEHRAEPSFAFEDGVEGLQIGRIYRIVRLVAEQEDLCGVEPATANVFLDGGFVRAVKVFFPGNKNKMLLFKERNVGKARKSS